MAIQLGTLERLGSFVGTSLGALAQYLTPAQVAFYFAELGITIPPSLLAQASFQADLSSAASTAGDLSDLPAQLRAAADNDDSSQVDDLSGQLLSAISDTIASLSPIVAAVGGVTTRQIIDDLLVRSLELEHPMLMRTSALFGVIDRTVDQQPSEADSFPARRPIVAGRAVHLDRLVDLLVDPSKYLRNTLGWGNGAFDATSLPGRLNTYLQLLGYSSKLVTTGPDSPRVEASPLVARPQPATIPPGLDLTFKFAVHDGLEFVLPIGSGLTARLATTGEFASGFKLTLSPPGHVGFGSTNTSFSASWTSAIEKRPVEPQPKVILLGASSGSRVEANLFTVEAGLGLAFDTAAGQASGEPFIRVAIEGGRAVLDFSQGDGFLTSLLSSVKASSDFTASAEWSPSAGLRFKGSASLGLTIPTHLTLGPVEISALYFSFVPSSGSFPLEVAARISAALGPVNVALDHVGLAGVLRFQDGNLGVADLTLGFKPPTGVGVSIEAGPVNGGGFLSFDETTGRYSGALELGVYGIAVKAFGIVDTKLPDGSDGYSFVVVISAEFTPIQLGFGFTLLGVGGMLGVNRSLNADGLQSVVRSGSLDNILFPTDVVANAPAIINDLATIFPAAPGHYVFGPMAKLGWGTPTLIDAELGIVLELPGPRLALLGVVNMALPTKDAALLSIHLAVAGLLDFPKKLFSIDASLYDSQVVGFPIRGDMAFRLSFGDEPNFALSVGGLHPSYQPPPGFPELARVAIDLGINGNPSLTASGYFALTSNTAQVGSALDLYASGAGIKLTGHLGYDALFVFSPFSFQASFSAGVRVSFHGAGLGIGLHGTISGPTPWHVSARACVSVLFWDACLPIDISFGTNKRAELPPIDPWEGTGDASVEGLRTAIGRPENWSGSFPKGAHPVVTLTEQASLNGTPIDPVGQATLRQKVLPLNFELTKFGIYKPVKNTHFKLDSIQVGGTTLSPPPAIQDKFAPALYKDMSDAEKIASQPYQKFDAGFTISPDDVVFGDVPSHTITYDTEVIDDQRNSTFFALSYALTDRHVTAMAARGAAALRGIRRSGVQAFTDPTLGPKLSFVEDELYVVADACSALAEGSFTEGIAVAQTTAQNALDQHLAQQPGDRGRYQVVPSYLAA